MKDIIKKAKEKYELRPFLKQLGFSSLEELKQGCAVKKAGRPRKEPTKVIRVPVSALDKINKVLEKHDGKRKKTENIPQQ
jgi:hypothetical protein